MTPSGQERTTPDATRLNLAAASRGLYGSLLDLDRDVHSSNLDPRVRELVKIRVSQMNGCAYCIDLHTREARALGETEQRMHGLSAWREAPYYTDQERAALALSEAITVLGDAGVSDAVYHEAVEQFTAEELQTLIWQAIVINAWNRIAITSQMLPGT